MVVVGGVGGSVVVVGGAGEVVVVGGGGKVVADRGTEVVGDAAIGGRVFDVVALPLDPCINTGDATRITNSSPRRIPLWAR